MKPRKQQMEKTIPAVVDAANNQLARPQNKANAMKLRALEAQQRIPRTWSHGSRHSYRDPPPAPRFIHPLWMGRFIRCRYLPHPGCEARPRGAPTIYGWMKFRGVLAPKPPPLPTTRNFPCCSTCVSPFRGVTVWCFYPKSQHQ